MQLSHIHGGMAALNMSSTLLLVFGQRTFCQTHSEFAPQSVAQLSGETWELEMDLALTISEVSVNQKRIHYAITCLDLS